MERLRDWTTRASVAGAAVAAGLFAYACFRYQQTHPPCCDADNYLRLAQALEREGFGADQPGSLRLYGYPTFLAALVRAAATLHLDLEVVVFIAQLTLYLLAAGVLSRAVAKAVDSAHTTAVVFLSLALNAPIYPYLGLPLSDALSLALSILLVALLVPILARTFSEGEAAAGLAGRFLLVGALLGAAVMVRPANLFLVPLVALALLLAFDRPRQRALFGGAAATATVIGFAAIVAPQVAYNHHYWGRATFLPTSNLGTAQVGWGVRYLEYATAMEGGAHGMATLNPWAADATRSLAWYFREPILGTKTAVSHLYAAVDLDAFFPYVYDLDAWHRPLTFLFSHTVLFWGLAALLFYARDEYEDAGGGFRRVGIRTLAGYVVLFGSWAALHAFTAVENRFALPVSTALLPPAVLGVLQWRDRRRILVTVGVFFLYLGLAWPASRALTALRVPLS